MNLDIKLWIRPEYTSHLRPKHGFPLGFHIPPRRHFCRLLSTSPSKWKIKDKTQSCNHGQRRSHSRSNNTPTPTLSWNPLIVASRRWHWYLAPEYITIRKKIIQYKAVNHGQPLKHYWIRVKTNSCGEYYKLYSNTDSHTNIRQLSLSKQPQMRSFIRKRSMTWA